MPWIGKRAFGDIWEGLEEEREDWIDTIILYSPKIKKTV